jgi:hypothetical protein
LEKVRVDATLEIVVNQQLTLVQNTSVTVTAAPEGVALSKTSELTSSFSG